MIKPFPEMYDLRGSGAPHDDSSPELGAQTISAKLRQLVGGGALMAATSLAPSNAHAAIVLAHGGVLAPPTSQGVALWDVDANGTNDFGLLNSGSVYAALDDRNGGRLVVPTAASSDGIAKLTLNEIVGNPLASIYKFQAGPQAGNTITSNGYIGADAFNGGWRLGDTGFFGFRFSAADGTHFGWGEMTIGNGPLGQGFTINEAFYESTAGVQIKVGARAVPEPSAISLLAFGAAGVGMWRRRRSVKS